MKKINWCLKQKKGIELVEANDNLSEAYFKDADDSIESMSNTKGMWKTVMAYYACYYALYALLMKVGIKCEIHDCSLALMQFFDFSEEDKQLLEKMKKERVEVQYYRKEAKVIDIVAIKKFLSNCKQFAKRLDFDKIEGIREQLAKND